MPPSLFLQPPAPPSTHFSKTAASEIKLGPDPNQWPVQILQEAYKTIPDLKEYQPEVIMQQTDPEEGAAYGALEIRTRGTQVPGAQVSEQRVVRIPILIREGKLAPLDLLIRQGTPESPSKTWPLTSARLRRAMFRPDVYDIVAPTQADTSIVSTLYPPSRDGYNSGGSLMGMGKLGHDLLTTALQLAPDTKVASLRRDLVASRDVLVANKEAHQTLRKVASCKKTTVSKMLRDKLASAPASVLQVSSLGDGTYRVKSASALAWAPEVLRVDRAQLLKLAAGDEIAALDTNGEITVTRGEGAPAPKVEEEAKLKLVTEPGYYLVREAALRSKTLVGLVFPNLIGLDGLHLPISVFTNGSVTALQGEIGGIRQSDAGPVTTGDSPKPHSYGMWMGFNAQGEFEATVPLSVVGGMSGAAGNGYLMEDSEGIQARANILPNIRSIVADGGELLIPMTYSWFSLSETDSAALAGPDQEPVGGGAPVKVASSNEVLVSCSGSLFTVRGPAVEKLAEEDTSGLTVAEAIFLLGGAGANLKIAEQALAMSTVSGRSHAVPVSQHITTPDAVVLDFERKVAAEGAYLYGQIRDKLPQSLVKEAGYLGDGESLDTVLALNLITPETIAAFVDKMPALEETLETLCELLLASRLGLKEIRSSALEKCIAGLEAVLEGLSSLKFQEPSA